MLQVIKFDKYMYKFIMCYKLPYCAFKRKKNVLKLHKFVKGCNYRCAGKT